ncbi:hypothetical protein NITMOv2_4201 [Nitrospira moscoviensis]|uniref:Uncharacterized protein n=1 Tax=Nitrospira moscoviensis TaxID=42253 RepID=A0A0K2GI22_NITMO|nr:hypothetical protein NITMOv2_4201 [Nitrospira moscoviensis]
MDHALRHVKAITDQNRILRFLEPHPHADVALLEGSSVRGVVHDRAARSLTERILAALHLTQRLGFEQGINGGPIDRLAFTTALVTQQSIFLSLWLPEGLAAVSHPVPLVSETHGFRLSD